MKLNRLITCALGLALMSAPCVANAEDAAELAAPKSQSVDLIDATDPMAIATILAEEGFNPILSKQESGAVQIQSTTGEVDFWLHFQACAPDFTACEVITFMSGFDFDTPQDPAIFGDWNREKLSKAYLDGDGDPLVEFSVNLVHGVTRDNFLDTLHWFALEVRTFMEQIDWHKQEPDSAKPI
ncbi:YbjN domain-containing protein [Henriciella sp. AS95]|uniref:YbjN domain-containing protein n=1 Tax=Henriciella sp. AS95 TaxID=3135782 RepID=UPI003181CB2A